MSWIRLFLFVFVLALAASQRRGVVLTAIKLFWSSAANGTVSKFPPIIEYFVQRIQSQNSNYVHEDLSRPPIWEKPVYTLAPHEQHLTSAPQEDQVTTTDPYEYEELAETTEKFFEIITGSDELA